MDLQVNRFNPKALGRGGGPPRSRFLADNFWNRELSASNFVTFLKINVELGQS